MTETWFFDNEIQFFKLDNYTFTGTQRPSRGGGAGAFVRNGLAVLHVSPVSLAGAEVYSFALMVGGSAESVRITIIYRQPSADTGALLFDFESFLQTTNAKNHMILEDFNIDHFDDGLSMDYKNLIASYNFTNVINIATRLSPQSLKWTCLDHTLLTLMVLL